MRLKERKCRSVALISGGGIADFGTFQKMAEEIGLKTRREWLVMRDTWTEEFGFDSFCRIWKGATKPDGLIVFPDSIAAGVIMAILQQGAKVPEQLKLVMHCHEEVDFHCPLAADWQVISIVKIVGALWRNLCAQADGKAPGKSASCLVLQPESAEIPPMHRKRKPGESL